MLANSVVSGLLWTACLAKAGKFGENTAGFSDLLLSSADLCLARSNGTRNETTAQSLRLEATPDTAWEHTEPCLVRDGTKFCAFTSHLFGNGRGISVLTSVNRANMLAESKPFLNALHHKDLTDDTRYEHAFIEGKGFGVITTEPIRRGDIIIADTPALMIDSRLNEESFRDICESHILPALEHLPLNHRQRYMNLSTQGQDYDDVETIRQVALTNSFNVVMDDDSFYAVFAEISRLNHECRPNCAYWFDTESLTHRVVAMHDIMPGQELSVSYIDPIQTREARQSRLERTWGFKCTCRLCTAPAHLAAESDARVAHILRLKEELERSSTTATPQKAELMVQLYRDEGLDRRITEAHYAAAMEWNGVGSAADAVRHARMGIAKGLLTSGPRDWYVQELRQIVDDPTEHWSWGFRLAQKWNGDEQE